MNLDKSMWIHPVEYGIKAVWYQGWVRVGERADHRVCYVQLGFKIVRGFLGRAKLSDLIFMAPFSMSWPECNSAYHRKTNSYTKILAHSLCGSPFLLRGPCPTLEESSYIFRNYSKPHSQELHGNLGLFRPPNEWSMSHESADQSMWDSIQAVDLSLKNILPFTELTRHMASYKQNHWSKTQLNSFHNWSWLIL